MSGRTSDEQQIANLVFRYAELVDAGQFDEVGALFAEATYVGLPGTEVARLMRGLVITYDDGTPRTRHVTTNLIIEIADEATATARSSFTVHQAVDGLALQPIVIGRYADTFAKRESGWVFTERQINMDLVGDMSRHLRRPPTPSHLASP
jgi:3-phenylpropionate/cinnamic acid dioxygenase small subunit